ncbi:hypothetical protein KKA93_01280 [Patescibacteria group bacterium]|nr:hypothetical protein [Patescibacteria group bacterium]MBU1663493.1 hypothetical protein [Patescibacteria group bacterium]MBU1933683.1 hypothetical protein [Patescibacteria group bacterium]MBU2007703.1 hypothetical protein [Patescibacteria group bacterium]MBU2233301.1 hypothetical protein [Patescibacteria group bacterium]
MFKFKKSFLLVATVLLCGIGVANIDNNATKAGGPTFINASTISQIYKVDGNNYIIKYVWNIFPKLYTAPEKLVGVGDILYFIYSDNNNVYSEGNCIIQEDNENYFCQIQWPIELPKSGYTKYQNYTISDGPIDIKSDLIIEDINYLIRKNEQYNSIDISVKYKNNSNIDINKSFYIQVIATSTSDYSNGYIGGRLIEQKIEAHKSYTTVVATYITYQQNTTFELTAVVDRAFEDSNDPNFSRDYDNRIHESNENNNTLTKTITIGNNEKCSLVCKNIGTRSEGWYDSCAGNLIKWENCGGVKIECAKAGESLGAVVPGNDKMCCPGLYPYIKQGQIGTKGICVAKKPEIKDQNVIDINTNTNLLYQGKLDTILTELKQLRDKVKEQATQIKYLEKLTTGVKELAENVKESINNFITYGVDENTKKLGAGERAAVMYSFKNAFNKLPETEQELADAIKIANGRWPELRNDNAEKKAKEQFQKIYKRIADMNNASDNAAITVMAYGLRQKADNRNLDSEKAGIKTFYNIYKHNPGTTEEWNIMQAITYSGASRGIDTDGDLLLDEREKELGTDPNKKDTDGDGHLDGEEVANGYDPLNK